MLGGCTAPVKSASLQSNARGAMPGDRTRSRRPRDSSSREGPFERHRRSMRRAPFGGRSHDCAAQPYMRAIRTGPPRRDTGRAIRTPQTSKRQAAMGATVAPDAGTRIECRPTATRAGRRRDRRMSRSDRLGPVLLCSFLIDDRGVRRRDVVGRREQPAVQQPGAHRLEVLIVDGACERLADCDGRALHARQRADTCEHRAIRRVRADPCRRIARHAPGIAATQMVDEQRSLR